MKTGILTEAERRANMEEYYAPRRRPDTYREQLMGIGVNKCTTKQLAEFNEKANAADAFYAGLNSLEGFASRQHQSQSARLAYERCYAKTKTSAEQYAAISGEELKMPGYIENTRTLITVKPTDWTNT